MPPTTTTTKASPIAIRSVARFAGSRAHLQRAAETGKERAERKHRREQHRLVDAERADHFAVLRRRAHQRPKRVRASPKCNTSSTSGPIDDQEQIVGRQRTAENFDRAAQARRARAEQIFRTPEARARHR